MEVITERYKSVYDFARTPIAAGMTTTGRPLEQHLAFVYSIRTGEKPLSGIDATHPAHRTALN
jgi:hypothetical protein